jgi:hypothetical protein
MRVLAMLLAHGLPRSGLLVANANIRRESLPLAAQHRGLVSVRGAHEANTGPGGAMSSDLERWRVRRCGETSKALSARAAAAALRGRLRRSPGQRRAEALGLPAVRSPRNEQRWQPGRMLRRTTSKTSGCCRGAGHHRQAPGARGKERTDVSGQGLPARCRRWTLAAVGGSACLPHAKLKVGEAQCADGTARGKRSGRTHDERAQPALNV